MSLSLLLNNKIKKVQAATTAGTSAVNSDIVDMDGFESVTFLTRYGSASSGNYVKVQQNTANSSTGMADLESTKVLPLVAGNAVAVEVVKPLERYLRLVCTRGVSASLGEIYAILSKAHKAPITNTVASEMDAEVHVSPAEGTA